MPFVLLDDAWRGMQFAPRDGNVIEIKGKHGKGVFYWKDGRWCDAEHPKLDLRSDDGCMWRPMTAIPVIDNPEPLHPRLTLWQRLWQLCAAFVLLAVSDAADAATRQMCSTPGDHCATAPRVVAKSVIVHCTLRKIGGSWVLIPPPGYTVKQCG